MQINRVNELIKNKFFSSIKNSKNFNLQKKIILCGTTFFALHTLYFIYSLSVNVPITDEWHWVPFVKMVMNGEPFWEFHSFWIYSMHGMLFPNLVFILSILLSSWNFIYLMYFGWILVSISVFVIFLILKNTFPNATWLIIPIAAIMYNPVQYENFLWALAGVQWFMVSSFMYLTIYFLNKINSNRYFILPSILCGIVSTFSGAPGISIWIVGFYSIFFQSKWKKSSLIIWTTALIVIFSIFFFVLSASDIIKGEYEASMFSINGINQFLFYLSHGIVLKFNLLRFIAGVFILISIISPILYFLLKKKMDCRFIPWIQLGFVGIFSAGLTVLGRFSTTGGIPSRYSTISVFDQIAALVIATIIIYSIYSRLSSTIIKKIIFVVHLTLFLLLILSLSSAYYFGWREGYQWKHMHDEFLECLLNPVFEFKCVNPTNFNLHNHVYEYSPILLDLNLEPFHDKILVPTTVPLLNDKEWNNMKMSLTSGGKIENIRFDAFNELNQNLPNYEFDDKSRNLQIYGWVILKNKNLSVESIYIFIDDKVYSKAVYGFLRKDLEKYGLEERSFSGWQGIIDPKKILFGCHDVSIRVVSGNEYSEIYSGKKLCKNSILSK